MRGHQPCRRFWSRFAPAGASSGHSHSSCPGHGLRAACTGRLARAVVCARCRRNGLGHLIRPAPEGVCQPQGWLSAGRPTRRSASRYAPDSSSAQPAVQRFPLQCAGPHVVGIAVKGVSERLDHRPSGLRLRVAVSAWVRPRRQSAAELASAWVFEVISAISGVRAQRRKTNTAGMRRPGGSEPRQGWQIPAVPPFRPNGLECVFPMEAASPRVTGGDAERGCDGGHTRRVCSGQYPPASARPAPGHALGRRAGTGRGAVLAERSHLFSRTQRSPGASGAGCDAAAGAVRGGILIRGCVPGCEGRLQRPPSRAARSFSAARSSSFGVARRQRRK